MGGEPSKFKEPLQRQPVPIWVTEPRFCQNKEVTLLLKEKLFCWSGDDFKIKDPNTGMEWFQVKGHARSVIREKKTLLDNYGTPVLNIKETIAFFEPNYKVFLGNNSAKQLFKVRAKTTFFKAKANVEIINKQNGQTVTIVLKGNTLSNKAMLYAGKPKKGGIPIARISRPLLSGREIFLGKQSYYITIAPNVDISMIVAICVCLDEMKKDD